MDFGIIFQDFGHVSAAAFAECEHRLARNEMTENVKNMQIAAETSPKIVQVAQKVRIF